MKNPVKRAIRDEKGSVLILVLILLVVGGLILTPLLGLMSTGLMAGQVYERKTAELYAADGGVEDAIWKIQHPVETGLPYECGDPPWSYDYEISDVNDKHVQVYIDYLGEGTHRITSTATTDGGGNTTVEAYLAVSYLDFSALLDNAIISYDTITIQPGTGVDGDVWLPDEDDLDNKGDIYGNVKDSEDVEIIWPTADQLSSYYWEQVKHLDPYPAGYVIDIPPETTEFAPYVIGPLFAAGDLTIKGTGWITLGGTIYVKGDLVFKATPEINMDLNQQTIFTEGDIYMPPDVNVSGSGCIIGVGDVDFQPSIDSSPDDFVLVMSVEGTVWFNPNGDFTGCIAGNAHVQLQPGNVLYWISPEGKGLDVPMGVGDDDKLPPVTGSSIVSWQIK